MTEKFFKFPPTPHLATLDNLDVRGDKVMSESERDRFLQNKLVVEEKVDGANLGLSFDQSGELLAQNRGSYLKPPLFGQWKKLPEWVASRQDVLFDHLSDRYILFGEWCYAQHSVAYSRLTDWFLGFDIFDKKHNKFFSCSKRDNLLQAVNIYPVPQLGRGFFSQEQLKGMFSLSAMGDEILEGLYLRVEIGDWLVQRAKLVRPAFMQSVVEHWSSKKLQPNRLKPVSDND